MIEWFGGERNVVEILLPLVGLCVLLIVPRITDTGRSRRYFLPAFLCWLSFQVLVGLEEGTLISFPYPVGLGSAMVLWIGFFGLFFRGLFAAWQERKSSPSSA